MLFALFSGSVGAWSKGGSQPGKLRVQAQAGLVSGFGGQRGKLGHGRVLDPGSAEAQVAGVGPAPAPTEMTALFESLIKEDKEDIHSEKVPFWHDH